MKIFYQNLINFFVLVILVNLVSSLIEPVDSLIWILLCLLGSQGYPGQNGRPGVNGLPGPRV